MNENKSKLTGIRAWWLAIPGGMLLLALLIGTIIKPNIMLSSRYLLNIFRSCGVTLLIGAAIAVPFSRGYPDLSVLGVAAFTGIISAFIANAAYLPGAVMILISVCIGAAIGVVNGLITMPLRRKNALFAAAVTACIGAFYRYIGYAVSNAAPVRISRVANGIFPLFLLPVLLLTGIFALLSFTGGGRRAFNGIYEKDENRNSGTIVPFLFSGILAGFAGALMNVRLAAAQPTAFTFNPSYVLLVALAGIAIPNVKKSKGGAFMGFISLIPAALTVAVLQNITALIGLNSYLLNIFFAVLAVIFIILNAVLGSKASKIEYVPAPKAAPAASGYASAADAYAATGKSKVAAILLAVFLGPIGVHRYYLGYAKQGVVQTIGFACMITGIVLEGPALYRNTLGMLVLALILLLFGLATSIWAFVDFIRIITGGLKPAGAPAIETRPTYVSEPVPTITPVEPVPAFTPAEPAPAPQPKPSASSQFGALAELANLYESGMITEEVYNRRKQEIFSDL